MMVGIFFLIFKVATIMAKVVLRLLLSIMTYLHHWCHILVHVSDSSDESDSDEEDKIALKVLHCDLQKDWPNLV